MVVPIPGVSKVERDLVVWWLRLRTTSQRMNYAAQDIVKKRRNELYPLNPGLMTKKEDCGVSSLTI